MSKTAFRVALTLAFVGGFVGALGAVAQPSTLTATKLLPDLLRPAGDQPAVTAPAPLLLALDGFDAEVVSMTVEVWVDGSLTFVEKADATLEAETGASVALPLLASDSRLRQSLATLAASGEAGVELRVLIDGAEVARRDLRALAAESGDLLARGVSLAALSFPGPEAGSLGDGEPLSSIPAAAGSCELNCEMAWINCLQRNGCQIPLQDSGKQQGLVLGGCGSCDSQYNQCLNNCSCTDPKSVTYPTVTTIVAITPLSGIECKYFIFDGAWFQFSQITYEITEYERIEYCDGTVTQEVVSVSYAYSYCDQYLGGFCSFPFLYAGPIC